MPNLVCFSSELFCIACRLHVDINTSGSRCSTGVLKARWNQNLWHVVQCICLVLTIHKIYLWCTVFVLDKLRRILITHVALHRFVSNQMQVACHGILMIKGRDKRSFDVPFLDVPPKVSVSVTKISTQEIKLEHIKHLHGFLKRGSPKNKNCVITHLLTLMSFPSPFSKTVHFQNTNEDNETWEIS